ncbi:hypothetical protein DENSPDRAFT_843264 [Dentipellis sp. KUC8613]|nr:hypothetical protein DENSPDRAFT_843264 [Dentipellis sp. KUC8613]
MRTPFILWISAALALMSAQATAVLGLVAKGPYNKARGDIPGGFLSPQGLPFDAASALSIHLPPTRCPRNAAGPPTAEIATPTLNTPNGIQPLPLPATQHSHRADIQARRPKREQEKSPRAFVTSWPAAAVTGSINDYHLQRGPQPGPRQ